MIHESEQNIEKILGRKQFKDLIDLKKDKFFKSKTILVTGANGSIGFHLKKIFSEMEVNYIETDIEGNMRYLDITDFNDCMSYCVKFQPDFIINLAGLKYATKCENQVWKNVLVNIKGVKNLIDASSKDCRVILTSTCKSANPEIVYGATKLIAERLVMNNSGSVARFFNVIETKGNVFEIWKSIKDNKIPVVSECNRHFISAEEACGLILYAMKNKGRFIVNTEKIRNMGEIADQIYPNKTKKYISRRRGDRKNEIFLATSESKVTKVLNDSILKIENDHDFLGKNFIDE